MGMTTAAYPSQRSEPELDRRDTAIRIALTVLFAIVAGILDSILGLVVVFGLLWAFITRRPPGEGLRNVANRLITFDYRIARYLTYNDQDIPFPFSEFPEPLEAPDWDAALGEAEALGFELSERDDEDALDRER